MKRNRRLPILCLAAVLCLGTGCHTLTELVIPHPRHTEKSVHERLAEVFDGLARTERKPRRLRRRPSESCEAMAPHHLAEGRYRGHGSRRGRRGTGRAVEAVPRAASLPARTAIARTRPQGRPRASARVRLWPLRRVAGD